MAYRDALDAAHERIRALERSREPRETSWTTVGLVAAIGAACVVTAIVAIAERHEQRRTAAALAIATSQRDDCEEDFERVAASESPPACPPPTACTRLPVAEHGTLLRVAVGASTAAPTIEAGDECTVVVLNEPCVVSIRCPAFRAEHLALTCSTSDDSLDRVRPAGAGPSVRYDSREGVVVIAPSSRDAFARATVLSRTAFELPRR